MSFSLAQDFADALATMPREHPRFHVLSLLDEAIRRDLSFLVRHPTTFFQCMWNSCWWHDCPDAPSHSSISEHEEAKQARSTEGAEYRLCDLLERWKALKSEQSINAPWLRSLRPPLIPLGQMLVGEFRGGVNCVALDPIGGRLFLGCKNGAIDEWDLDSQLHISHATPHKEAITALACSADGRYMASGDEDGDILVWNLQTMQAARTNCSHFRRVSCLRFLCEHPDCFVSGSADESVRVWNAATAQEIARHGHPTSTGIHAGPAIGIAVQPRIRPGAPRKPISFLFGDLTKWPDRCYVWQSVLSDCFEFRNGAIKEDYWDIDSRKVSVTCVAGGYDPKRQTTAWVGHEDGVISARHWLGKDELLQFQALQGEVTSIAPSADGEWIACGSKHGELAVWAPWSKQRRLTLTGHNSPITELHFVLGTSRLVSLGSGECFVWDLDRMPQTNARIDHAAVVTSIQVARNGVRAVSVDVSDNALIWNTRTGTATELKLDEPTDSQELTLSPDGSEVAIGGNAGLVKRWKLTDSMPIAEMNCGGPIHAIVYSPDGSLLAIAAGQELGLWSVDSSRQFCRLMGHSDPALLLAFSPDGDLLASASGPVLVHSIVPNPPTSDEPIEIGGRIALPGQDDEVWWSICDMAFSANGDWLYVQQIPTSLATSDAYLNNYTLSAAMQIQRIAINPRIGPNALPDSRRSSRRYDRRTLDFAAPTTVDLRGLALGRKESPLLLESRLDLTVLRNEEADKEVAWLPYVLTLIEAQPGSNVWMVASGRYVGIFELAEGP